MLYGHGGLFKTKGVGQRLHGRRYRALPVAVMETAGEGGPWGMALLAAYRKDQRPGGEPGPSTWSSGYLPAPPGTA